MLYLFILDSLGTSEFLFILVVALIFLGPRKLPQLSRQIGKSLAEFKKASEDFKRTWEREVSLETVQPEPESNHSIMPQDSSVIEATVERSQAVHDAAANNESTGFELQPASTTGVIAGDSSPATSNAAQLAPTRKQDWL
jgi:sec-independent protein translocase protein TatB